MKIGLLIAAAALLAMLGGCKGCGEQNAPPPTPAPPTAAVASAALGEPSPTPPDYYIIAFAEAEPDVGPAPLTVRFGVWDPFHNIDGPTYYWDFGDGSPPSTKKSPKHTYERPGNYTATLKVTDAAGKEDEDTIEIQVREPAPTSGG
jgi:PKD repeat protein